MYNTVEHNHIIKLVNLKHSFPLTKSDMYLPDTPRNQRTLLVGAQLSKFPFFYRQDNDNNSNTTV